MYPGIIISGIFAGVTISCADIPTGDKDAIIGAVLAMGGMETNNLTKATTHICALTVDHPKCQSAREKNLKCMVVLPHWYVYAKETTSCNANYWQVR